MTSDKQLLATPVDFENDSLLNIWSSKEYFDVDKFVDTYGNVSDGGLAQVAFGSEAGAEVCAEDR
jgi:hypothetical protein